MKERIAQLLGEPVAGIQKLFGDASYRTYYRVSTQNGSSFVLMTMPEGKMGVSEEITNLKEQPAELPFINVQKFLKKLGLPVPAIHHFSKEEGWLVLEDLGDVKFFDVVHNAEPKEQLRWYKKVIDLLVVLQNKTRRMTHDARRMTCIAFERSFNATLFNWEFEHFWEYFWETGDQRPETKDQKIFKTETRKITEELCKLPQGFTHRDYQSRNLMVRDGEILILDFQDALLGPKVYDLVCLLRDSYVDLTPHLDEFLAYYCQKGGEDAKTFRRAFDLQTVQRKLKDSGRFVFIDRVKKNPNFLPFIPTSMGYVRQSLERLPEYQGLYAMLKKYVGEW